MTTRRNLILIAAAFAAMAAGSEVMAKDKSCPPGLAKKSPACVPPGQAKKHVYRLDRGDRIDDYDYRWLRYPDDYGLPHLPRGQRYYVVDGNIYRVDQDTYEILDFVRALGALLD